MTRILALWLFFGLISAAYAQPAPQTSITSQSGRLAATVPPGWVAVADARTDIQRNFTSEALTFAEDDATLDQVALGPNIGGSHVVVAMLSMLDVYPLNPTPANFEDVTDYLFGADNAGVQRLEISGLPAARLSQAGGISFTLVGLPSSVLAISAQADDEADAPLVDSIIESLSIQAPGADWATTPDRPLATRDGRLTLNTGADWYAGQNGDILYTAPHPSAIQDFGFGLLTSGPLQAPFVGVVPVSYSEYFAPNDTPDVGDLQRVLDVTLSEFGAAPVEGFNAMTIADYPAVATLLQAGPNGGAGVAIDAGQTIYVYLALYPAEDAARYGPLADDILTSIAIQPLAPEVANLPPEGLRAGFRAPDFSATWLDGQTRALSDLGGGVVMLNFWFTTCPPCQAEMPAMQAVYDEYAREDFTILAVNNREIPEQIRPFMQGLGLEFPVALDTTGTVQSQYEIFSYPSSLFIDPQGIIYQVDIQPMTEDEIRAAVEAGLARRE